MSDFEEGRLPAGSFHHAEHVRMAFVYLRRFPPLEALDRFYKALERMAAANAKPDRYHETMTWSFVFLIRERIERRVRETGRPPNWYEFAAENLDLLRWNDHALKKYYSDEALNSELARRVFILPDRGLVLPDCGLVLPDCGLVLPDCGLQSPSQSPV
jgi:hypothetical protein